MKRIKMLSLTVAIVLACPLGVMAARIARQDAERAAFAWVRLENRLSHLRLAKQAVSVVGVRDLFFAGETVGFVVDLAPQGFLLMPLEDELAPVKFACFSTGYDETATVPFLESVKGELYEAAVRLGYLPPSKTARPEFSSAEAGEQADILQLTRNRAAWDALTLSAATGSFPDSAEADAAGSPSAFRGLPLAPPSPLSPESGAATVAPLLASTWNQDFPYNVYTPPRQGASGTTFTGCTITATAQIMHFWKYPATGRRSHTYYHPQCGLLSADFDHPYYWDRMVDHYTGSESEAQIDAVARLMADLGIAFEANYYGAGGTSAALNPQNALSFFFRYAWDIEHRTNLAYQTPEQVFQLFQGQLDQGWPVLAAGKPIVTGILAHAVVVDGYRQEAGQNQIHVNLGWGGFADSYYTVDNIYGSWTLSEAVINIHPPACAGAGNISGRVTDASTGVGVGDALIGVLNADQTRTVQVAWTNAAGYYTVDCLPPGNYWVMVDDDSLPYHLGGDRVGPLPVTAGQTTSGADFALYPMGRVAGNVHNAGHNGIPYVMVYAYMSNGAYLSLTITDALGNYDFKLYPSAMGPQFTYKIFFDTSWSAPGLTPLDYLPQWYNGKDSQSAGDSVTVNAGQTTTKVNARLLRGGSIAGRVVDAWGAGLSGVEVVVRDESGALVRTVTTNSTGDYCAAKLSTGRYKIVFQPGAGSGQAYACYANKNTYANADWVHVTAGETTGRIDAMLNGGGAVTGRITGPEGQGIAGLTVAVYNLAKEEVTKRTAVTDGAGSYTVDGLPRGKYTVWVNGGEEFVSAWRPGIVDVAGGVITPGIDLQLAVTISGTIAGHVSDSSGAALSSVGVYVYDLSQTLIKSTWTDAVGNYAVTRLAPAGYKVQFWKDTYVTAWYNGRSDFAQADPVNVGTGVVTADTVLLHPGSIGGLVTDASGNPLTANVKVYDLGSNLVAQRTGVITNYIVTDLPPGNYKVLFEAYDGGYAQQWYQAKPSFAAADPVLVRESQITPNIGAQLVPLSTAPPGPGQTNSGGPGPERNPKAIPPAERAALIALYYSTDGDNWTNNAGWLGPEGTEASWAGVFVDPITNHIDILELQNNNLNGTLPPELADLTHLEHFSVWMNRLHGPIPTWLGGLAQLQILYLGKNQFSGEIPAEWANLTRLEGLDLAENRLEGPLPRWLGNFTELEALSLGDNRFIGEIPATLGNLTKLLALDLRSNQLSGPIPPDLGSLSQLQILLLYENHLDGPIPAELGNLSELDELLLDYNELSGPVPPSLGSLAKLRLLRLNGNKLSGPIPNTLANLSGLELLDIGYNALYTSDSALASFLANRQEDWQDTQTVAPENGAAVFGDFDIALSWNAIPYTGNYGGYRLYYSKDGGPYALETATSSKTVTEARLQGLNLPDHAHCFYLQSFTLPHSENESNQVESEPSAVFSPDAGCNCPPMVGIVNPAPNAYVGADTLVEVLVQAKGKGGINRVDLYLDDQFQTSLTSAPYRWMWDTHDLLGQYRIKAVATEAGALTSTAENVVHVVDKAHDRPPTIDILTPLADAFVSGRVLVQAGATDDQGIARVEFYLDNALKAVAVTAPYQWVWDATDAGGVHDIQVIAYDTVAQTAYDSASVTVKTLDAEPTAAIVVPAPNATVCGPVAVRANAFDDKGVAKVEFFVDDGLKATVATSPYAFTWDSTNLNGAHVLKVVVTDTVGQTALDVVQVLVDSALMPPSIAVQPQDQVIKDGASASLAVTALGGPPLAYQWYRVDRGYPAKINGAVAPTYSTPALTENGFFFVEVANPHGKAVSITAKVAIDRTSSLEGEVWDGALLTRLAGVTLAFQGLAVVTTDANGHYTIPALPPGDYEVDLIKGGFKAQRLTVGVPGSSQVTRDFTMYPNGGEIRLDSLTTKYQGQVYALTGRDLPVRFTAHVDWAGHPRGVVRFSTSKTSRDAAVDPLYATASVDLNVKDDFGACDTLRAVAVSTDGTQSPPKEADFKVVALPSFLPAAPGWNRADGGDGFLYHATAGVNFPFLEESVEGGNLKGIPFLSQGALLARFLPSVDQTFKSSGEYEMALAWDNSPSYKEENQVMFGFAGIEVKLMPKLSIKSQYGPDCSSHDWGTLGFSGSVEKKSVWPFWVTIGPTPPIPMFFKATFNLTTDATLGVKSLHPLTFDGGLVIKPSLRGSLGAGIDEVVALEGWVQGGFEFAVTPPRKVNYYFSAGVTATAWIFKYECEGFKWEGNWPQASTGKQAPGAAAKALLTGPPQLIPRDYLDLPGAGRFWPNAGSGPAKRETPARCAPLQTAGFPFAEPCLSSWGGQTGLVWLKDNPARSAVNRTMAVFSCFDGANWSAPQPLSDDGTADFHPQVLMFADGSALAAWENVQAPLADDATPGEVAAQLGVAAAGFDPLSRSWSAAQPLSPTGQLNRNPKLAGRDRNNVIAAWVANADNDQRGGFAAPNEVRFALFDGVGWSQPGLAASVSFGIVKYSLTGDGNRAWVTMTLDTDNDPSTVADHELYLLEYRYGVWQGLTRLTEDNLPDENPQTVLDPGGRPILVWMRGNEVASAVDFDLAHARVIMTDAFSSEFADFRLTAAAGGRLAVVWAEPSHYSSDIQALFYDPATDSWSSQGQQLTFDPETERRVTAAFRDDDTLLAVFDQNRLGLAAAPKAALGKTASADQIPVVQQTDLVVLQSRLDPDLALDPATFASFPGNPAPGAMATLGVTVRNVGARPASNPTVAFFQGDPAAGGTRVGQAVVSGLLKPGDRQEASVRVSLPETAAPVRFFAVVDPDAAFDVDHRLNNSASLELMQPDLAVVSLFGVRRPDGRVTLHARTGNVGSIGSGPTTLRFRTDSPYGPLLAEGAVPALTSGAAQESIAVCDLPANPAQGLIVYAAVDEADAVAEYREDNNAAGTVVTVGYNLAVTSPHGGENWTAGSERTIAWIQRNMTGPVTVALYQGAAKVLDLGAFPVEDGKFTWTIPANLAAGGGYRIRLALGGVEAWSPEPFTLSGGCQTPIISGSPADVASCPGAPVTLTVLAGGSAPLHFQWYQGEAGDRAYPVGDDAATCPVTVPGSPAAYWVEVSNACGWAESLAAHLTPLIATEIRQQPADRFGDAGSQVTLTVGAAGSALTYQWYRGLSGDETQAVAGGSGPQLSVQVTTLQRYWVKVTGGCKAAASRTVLVSVTGDVDGSGLVDAADQTLLARYLAESPTPVLFYPEAGDLNHDGRVDILDLLLLKHLCSTKPDAA